MLSEPGRSCKENELFASACPGTHRNGSPRTVALPSTAPPVGKWDKVCLCIPRASPTHPSIPTADPHAQVKPRAGGSRCSSPWRALPAPPGHTEGQRLGPRSALPTCAPFSERSPAHTDYSGCGFPQRLLPEQHLPCSHRTRLGCDTGTVLVAVTLTGRAHATADPMPTHRAQSGSQAGPCPSHPAPAVRHQARVPAPRPHRAPNSRHSPGAAQRSPGEAAAAAGRRRGERSGQYLLRRHLSLL